MKIRIWTSRLNIFSSLEGYARLKRVRTYSLALAIILSLLVANFGHALEPVRSDKLKRETFSVVTGPANQGKSYDAPKAPNHFQFYREPRSPLTSGKSTPTASPRKHVQPVVPEIVELSSLKRNVNPVFRPASLKSASGERKTPRTVKPKWDPIISKVSSNNLKIKAKALFCIDRSSNRVLLAENDAAPLPIASITKLLTAMVVIDDMDLQSRVVTPNNIREVEKHTVGIKSGDIFTVYDLLHGMLIESGNDCAEALARAYPKGGRAGFITAMNKKAADIGASSVRIYTPSGLDHKLMLGRKDGRELLAKKPNVSTAQDVALVADHAFKYPLVSRISSMKKYTMRTLNDKPKDYPLFSNDRLLDRNLPVAGAKTGFTNMAGKCIVALFRNEDKEHLVVVLNTPQHFKAAEKIYRWAAKSM